jgi:hypothetical protein
MGIKLVIAMALGVTAMVSTFSCSKNSDSTVASSKKLYIATGLCYSGTGFNPPAITDVGQLVSRLDISSRAYEVVHDYGNLADEDIDTYANGITDGGDGYIYVAVENPTSTGNRRIDKIARAAFGARTVWQPSTADLSAGVLRGIARADDEGVLVGRTTTVERYDATPQNRDLAFNVSWGDNSLGACATNNTRITDMISLPKVLSTDQIGKYIYAHAAAGQMDIGVISKDGSNLAANCLANAPGGVLLAEAATANAALNETLSATATPTSLVYIPTGAGTGKLLVAYSSSTANGAQAAAASLSNALVMYDFAENTAAGETATLTNGTVLYNDVYFFGVTAMAYDSSANMLYVAAAKNQNPSPEGYNIERFSIDLTTPGATRVTDSDNSSFEEPNSFTKCPTSMFVGD